MIKVKRHYNTDGTIEIVATDTAVKVELAKWGPNAWHSGGRAIANKRLGQIRLPKGTSKADIKLAMSNFKQMFETQKELI